MRSLLAVAVFGVVASATPASAAPGQGTTDDPVVVDALPYFAAGSTLDAPSSEISSYDCEPGTDESGPEVLYRFDLAADARVTAWVEGDDGIADIDVHLLEGLDVQDGVAVGCAARGNAIAEADLAAGEHWISVDSFNGADQAGAFVVRLYAVGEEWMEIPIGTGVTWRARRFEHPDGPQVVSAVDADPGVAGVSFEVVDPDGCQTVAQIVSAHPVRPVAAVNSSFFMFDGVCTSASFMKHDGEVLAFDAGPALGLSPDIDPSVTVLPANTDWPEVTEAQGGTGLLVDGGVATQGAAAWSEQGINSAGFIGANPRTFAGHRADGSVVFATVDGRRSNAVGMSLDALASWAVDEFSCEGAVNWDGGGSTTMWVADMTPGGVVNYPSDAGMVEEMDHAGARSLGGAVFVHADPYNWAPRFQTEPVLEATAGENYVYDADAIDLNVEDVVVFSLAVAPEGMTIDPVTGDIDYAATTESPPEADVTIVASDGNGGQGEQTYVLEIAGGMGSGDSGGSDETGGGGGESDTDTGVDSTDGSSEGDAGDDTAGGGSTDAGAGASQDDDAGCGCTAPGGGTTPLQWLLLGLLVPLSRTRSRPR